jgi:two-component system cell cycle sensor histidine kinase/response regulator CckA
MKRRRDVRVLIAEDDYLAGEMLRAMLEEVGYTVIDQALDGQQAVEMTSQLAGTPDQPDVVLMDIEMPGMDGIEATKLIQESYSTPVVVLTAYETPELVAQASEAGVGAYLVKPPEIGDIERAVIIAMARFGDMMALRQSNRRLEETLAELEATQQQVVQQERLAAVGQLAAGIAHEFNNIMSSVILCSEILLAASNLSPEVRARLTTIRQQGQRAADLTQQILDFGRRAILQRRDLDLLSFMVELRNVLQRTLPESISVHLSCHTDEITVNADSTRLQQAIMNLVLNARDAMPAGGELGIGLERVRFEDSQETPLPEMRVGEWARLTVTDTGSGIPPDVLPHIFEPFFTTRAPLGSGMGLSQTYGVVKQHQGHIDVDTAVGEGTTFTIYLPALPAPRPETLPSEAVEMPEGNGETILVVEENLVMRRALADCLTMLNYRALTVADGREALALFERQGGGPSKEASQAGSIGGSVEEARGTGQDIALVLSDLVMPEIGGMVLCRALKKRNPAVRVVILTSYPLQEEAEELASVGVVSWLQKPVSFEQLAKAVAQALKEDKFIGAEDGQDTGPPAHRHT